ncbi:YPL264C [Symbiodinium natans]|uniref:YPL264C protein n=1 Tax=Symbiodinium natans TaxID=878477 RepID=A0A812TGN1_9DINO|nr:YPL264C [Symbiodinium natans]
MFSLMQLLLTFTIGFVGFSSQCVMTIGMQKEKSATASLVRQSLCPVFALLWQGLFFPDESLSWTSFAGFCTILLGLAVTVVFKAFRESSHKPKLYYSHVQSEEKPETQDMQEDGTPSKLDHTQCLPSLARDSRDPALNVLGKRSFFDEAPGVDRENEMIELLQKEGFSRRQAVLALEEVGWSSPKAALDILLDCKYGDAALQRSGDTVEDR